MINIDKIMGRLGNKMFQFAFLYSYALNNVWDYYYQDPYFFEDHKEAVRTLFSANIPNKTNAVAIHVRRGDYVGNPFYVDLMETDYYDQAIKMFPNDRFLVFSDDPLFCEEKWKGDDRFSFSYGDEIEDMNLMASCKAQIISNSSFSWWGAWLCPDYPDNKVIAPLNWYADGDNSRTILPKHWIRL